MDNEGNGMDFEDSVMPQDLGSFFYPDGDGNDDYYDDEPGASARGVASSYQPLPRLPQFPLLRPQPGTRATSLSGLPSLPKFPSNGEETFGGEHLATAAEAPLPMLVGDDVADGHVQAYDGVDTQEVCRSIVAIAGSAGLESPLKLRQLVSQAIGGGPLPREQKMVPYECYSGDDDFSRAFSALSISAYAGPSALVLELPECSLAIIANGSEIVLVDPGEQTRMPGGEKGNARGALVMRCRDHLEVSAYIRKHYQTRPSSGELYMLQHAPFDESAVTRSSKAFAQDFAAAKKASEAVKTELRNQLERYDWEVAEAKKTGEPVPVFSSPHVHDIVSALDTALRTSGSGTPAGVTAALDTALRSSAKSAAASSQLSQFAAQQEEKKKKREVDLKTMYKVDPEECLRTFGGVSKSSQEWKTQAKLDRLKDLFDSDPAEGIREDPVISELWKSQVKVDALKDLYTKVGNDQGLRPMGGIVTADAQRIDDERRAKENNALREMGGIMYRDVAPKDLKSLYQTDKEQPLREFADITGPISDPVAPPAGSEDKNKEGKRERTPPSPPAMGSPVRMASDDEEKPKRAKTPPLVSAEPVSAPVPPIAVVKAERRKSAPKSARTSGVAVTAVPTAAPKKAPAGEAK